MQTKSDSKKFAGITVGLVVAPDGEPHIGFTLGDERLAMSLDCANLLFNQIGDLLDSQGFFDQAEGDQCQMH